VVISVRHQFFKASIRKLFFDVNRFLMKYNAIVIGSSAGGLYVLISLLKELSVDYPLPIILIQHRSNENTEMFEEVLQHSCKMKIKQADEKENVIPGIIYVAPPGYHLLIEQDRSFSLSSDGPVKFSMPSIDVTFESAAEVYKRALVGIILTGASDDGATGIKTIKQNKGLTIAQDPNEAQFPFMPRAAIETGGVDMIWPIKNIQQFLLELPLKQK